MPIVCGGLFDKICKYQFFGQREALLHNKGGETADKYEFSVLLTTRKSSTDTVRVFLRRLFKQVFPEADVDMINNGMINNINLIFHGTCEKSSAYLLLLRLVQ